MSTVISVDTDIFKGSFTCTIETKEWQYFVKQLELLYNSVGKELEVTWQAMENALGFDFNLKKSGNLLVSYKLTANPAYGSFLSGEFITDQSYLPQWLQSAKSS